MPCRPCLLLRIVPLELEPCFLLQKTRLSAESMVPMPRKSSLCIRCGSWLILVPYRWEPQTWRKERSVPQDILHLHYSARGYSQTTSLVLRCSCLAPTVNVKCLQRLRGATLRIRPFFTRVFPVKVSLLPNMVEGERQPCLKSKNSRKPLIRTEPSGDTCTLWYHDWCSEKRVTHTSAAMGAAQASLLTQAKCLSR